MLFYTSSHNKLGILTYPIVCNFCSQFCFIVFKRQSIRYQMQVNLNNDIMFNMVIYIVYGFTFARIVQIIFEILLLRWYLSSKQDLFWNSRNILQFTLFSLYSISNFFYLPLIKTVFFYYCLFYWCHFLV